MPLVLDLRERLSHAGVPLVHPTSEHVVLANVLGTLKNFSANAAINPWLETVTGKESVKSDEWKFSFWEKQPRPIGVLGEGSTEVDLVLEANRWIIFLEVKMDAQPSYGTKSDPERNQLLRNLDVGYRRAREAGKAFALIYVTPDLSEPEIVSRVRTRATFPANVDVDADDICACLFWSSWGLLGKVIAASYSAGKLDRVERKFALDLLAYLCAKRLWENTLADEQQFYEDKLYRSLGRNDSPFIPYSSSKTERYQAWRTKPWEEEKLREYLEGLRWEDKALLKMLADANGALQQRTIMQQLPFLRGRTSASLRSLKSHVNAGCRQLDCAQILAEGSGSGEYRIHEINPNLGELRAVVIEHVKRFTIPWHLLERDVASTGSFPSKKSSNRTRRGGRAWLLTENSHRQVVAALVDAKGSCSCRLYDASTGRFLRKLPNARGSFRSAFAHIMAGGKEFEPPFQPNLVSTEKLGLPPEVLGAAQSQRKA